MQASNVGGLRAPRGLRVAFVVALACWTVGVVVYAALPEGSTVRYLTAGALYYAAAGFALVSSVRTASGVRGRERLFWGLLVAGLLAGLVGDLGWDALQRSAFAAQDLSYHHAAYLVFYLFFACAMLILVNSTTKGDTFVVLLDSLGIMISSGILVWYFFLGRTVAEAGPSWAVLAVLSWPLFDVALFFLGLVVFTTAGRPPFVGLLMAGFVAFALADGWYLWARSGGSYGAVGWPDLFWALGFVFVGLAAFRAVPMNTTRQRIGPWRVFALWLGPLSPAIQLSIVLVWGAEHPPLPAYVSYGGAILLLYLALRIALISFVNRRLNREQEAAARKGEQGRVLYELHDTVKQGVHGISLSLRAALEAERRGEHDAARRMLTRALEVSQEAEFRVSQRYDELQAIHGEVASNPSDYLRHRLMRFEEYFGIQTHEDFRVPFEFLRPAEVAAAQRVFVEASWNAVKHAQARNLWLETRRVGSVVIVRIRDDGRGFDTGDPPPGLGLRYMRRRAEEVGAEVDIISSPGRGTSIQLRFANR
ncbi:MAG TPA: ATP-binding protein [Rubrobacteraceae bacterium]|nr:ATP-binding protein [Rubrobacteraceae bacterium]